MRFVILCSILVATVTAGGDVSASGPRQAALPVAPDATHFMWQGQQTAFVDGSGQPCSANIAISVGDQAVCYASPEGKLICAGQIYTSVFGPTFTEVRGVEPVEQILISLTENTSDGNAICVKTKSGKAYCMGNEDYWGLFGTGVTGPSASFVRYGSVDHVVALATGTWDQMCAVTEKSGVYCAGYQFGPAPVSVAASAQGFYIDGEGEPQVDDPSVFRVANSRSDSRVQPAGGVFDFPPPPLTVGQPGDVVDVVGTGNYNPPDSLDLGASRGCWLDGQGAAWCAVSGSGMFPLPVAPPPVITQVFTARKVLALAGNFYSDTLCAVYDDGSIACTGNNQAGQLGLATPSYVTTETIVQPPGSVSLRCN